MSHDRGLVTGLVGAQFLRYFNKTTTQSLTKSGEAAAPLSVTHQ